MSVSVSSRISRQAGIVAAALAASLAMTAMSPPAADARSSSMYRETGRAVSTDRVQIDGTVPGSNPLGNTHVGQLSAYETTQGKATAWGKILDWDCEEGELPAGGHHGVEISHHDAPHPGSCDFIGSRWLEGDDLDVAMDRKVTIATLQGQLVAYGGGHGADSGAVGYPQADIVWTGIDGTYTSRWTSRYSDEATTWTESYRSTERGATMGGTLGPMGFDPGQSSGHMSTYPTSSKSRTK